ncbi:hypothetical protein L6452_32825 [Arctium lappa]|uniref:Uncharacterized protein n=1 Tax=Arctium lappa TaxID=4217 RepID=A0ACB8Z4S4_ARCLA|nr:hypothetical protein L6452_32825 [Arctium lappa]
MDQANEYDVGAVQQESPRVPQCLFSSHTLKHLTLASSPYYIYPCGQSAPKSAWDFPVLETLNLSNLKLGDEGDESLNLFSKCVNLKDLTLHQCSMFGLEIFNVCAPQLSNLTITDHDCFSKVFNVVAPQLENLTTSVNCTSRRPEDFSFLRLSTEGLDSLEKVNLSLSKYSYMKKKNVPQLLDLFQKLCSAKFLILDKGIVEVLSSCVDQLLHEPCPFNNLKCLKQKECMTTMPTQLKNYFLESSPGATFIMDLPQVPRKRSREEVDNATIAKKVAKLEEEKQQRETMKKMQDEVVAQQKEMVKLHFENLVSRVMSLLQLQVKAGNPDYKLIRLIKSTMELTPERLRVAMEARPFCLYEEMKSLFLTHIDASQWAKIEMELGITERTSHSDNVHGQSDVLVAVLPSPSSANVSLPFILWLHPRALLMPDQEHEELGRSAFTELSLLITIPYTLSL